MSREAQRLASYEQELSERDKAQGLRQKMWHEALVRQSEELKWEKTRLLDFEEALKSREKKITSLEPLPISSARISDTTTGIAHDAQHPFAKTPISATSTGMASGADHPMSEPPISESSVDRQTLLLKEADLEAKMQALGAREARLQQNEVRAHERYQMLYNRDVLSRANAEAFAMKKDKFAKEKDSFAKEKDDFAKHIVKKEEALAKRDEIARQYTRDLRQSTQMVTNLLQSTAMSSPPRPPADFANLLATELPDSQTSSPPPSVANLLISDAQDSQTTSAPASTTNLLDVEVKDSQATSEGFSSPPKKSYGNLGPALSPIRDDSEHGRDTERGRGPARGSPSNAAASSKKRKASTALKAWGKEKYVATSGAIRGLLPGHRQTSSAQPPSSSGERQASGATVRQASDATIRPGSALGTL